MLKKATLVKIGKDSALGGFRTETGLIVLSES